MATVGADVVVVSFGDRKGALMWRQQTECAFTVLLDSARQLYNLIGFKRSAAKVWCIETMTYYADQLAAGRHLPQPQPDIDDDPHQMGGDIILNGSGSIVYVYRSKSASDRPSVETLLKQCSSAFVLNN